MKLTEGTIVQMDITSLYKKFKQPTLGRIEYNEDGDFYILFKMVKPEIPLALDGGMNGVRGNYYKLLEKQKSSQISITISPDFCL